MFPFATCLQTSPLPPRLPLPLPRPTSLYPPASRPHASTHPAAAEWSEEEEEGELSIPPLSFKPPRRAMIPLSASFSAADAKSPDSPWRRFPAMLANFKHKTSNFASFGMKTTPGTPHSTPIGARRAQGHLLAATPPERFVRSVSCEMGELRRSQGPPTSASTFNLTQLMRFRVGPYSPLLTPTHLIRDEQAVNSSDCD